MEYEVNQKIDSLMSVDSTIQHDTSTSHDSNAMIKTCSMQALYQTQMMIL